MTTGLVVNWDGTRRIAELGTTDREHMEALKEHVGGFLEMVSFILVPPLVMWCNEDGHALELPPNPHATVIAQGYTPIVLGNVVFTGGPDVNGGLTSIPEMWRAMFTGEFEEHPCRDCGRLYSEHRPTDSNCEGWV